MSAFYMPGGWGFDTYGFYILGAASVGPNSSSVSQVGHDSLALLVLEDWSYLIQMDQKNI